MPLIRITPRVNLTVIPKFLEVLYMTSPLEIYPYDAQLGSYNDSINLSTTKLQLFIVFKPKHQPFQLKLTKSDVGDFQP